MAYIGQLYLIGQGSFGIIVSYPVGSGMESQLLGNFGNYLIQILSFVARDTEPLNSYVNMHMLLVSIRGYTIWMLSICYYTDDDATG